MTQIIQLQYELADLVEKQLHLIIPSSLTDLFESGIMDSLIFVDLLVLLEREFGLDINMQQIQLEDFKSLESISFFINEQLVHVQKINSDYAISAVVM